MPSDRERYNGYVKKINEMLSSDEYYEVFQKKLRAAKPILKLNKKHRTKSFDLDWVDMIESTLPHLDNIVRNPRKFIVIEEDIVDISLARAISTESVKHLAQHTNLISSVDKDGMVTPNKILNTTKEESFEIYENRFIYTLLKNLSQFVTRRLEAIKKAYINDNVLELDVDTSVFTGKTRVFYNLELIASLPIDEVKGMEKEDMTVVERIAKMQRIINEFLGSPFAKQMVNSAPVRPPITRTNVILKNPDFKKALVLWQFVESYTKTGFAVDNEIKKVDIPDEVRSGVLDAVCLNSMLMEGLIDGQVEDSAFYNESNLEETDIVEDEKKEPPKEEEKPEEPPKEEEKEEEKPEEEKPEEEKPEEEKEPEIEEKEVEKEVEKEIEVENQIPEISDAIDEQTPQDEEQTEDNKPEEEEEEEDEEADQYQELLSETKNVFQRSTDEATMSRAELQRINKAIDRVLLKFRLTNAQEASKAIYEQVQDEEADRAKLVRQIEKEMEVVRRAIDKRIMIAERERLANERALEKERKRLAELEEKLKEQKALAGEEEDDDDEIIEEDVVGDLVEDIEKEDIEEAKREAKVEEFEELLEGQDSAKLKELGEALLSKHGGEPESSGEELEKALEESSAKETLKADDFVKPKRGGRKPKLSAVKDREQDELDQEIQDKEIALAKQESAKKDTIDASDMLKGRRKPLKKASAEKEEIIEEDNKDDHNEPPKPSTPITGGSGKTLATKTLKGSKVKGRKVAKLSDVK